MNTQSIYRPRHAVIACVLLAGLWLPTLSVAQDYPERGDAAKGAQTWANNCSRCHNMRDPQDLRDDQWITSVSHMRVRAGLTGQQARDILTFLQDSNTRVSITPVKFGRKSATEAESLSGEAIYNQTCIACHGSDGKGKVPGAPDLTNADGPLSQPDEVLLRHITEGFKSPNSAMAMPPKGGNPSLTESDVQSVLKFMRARFGR